MVRKRKPWREGESNRCRASSSLKSPMSYQSPTVTLKLHCEQFWTFIVIVTFDLLRTLLRMRACVRTDKQGQLYIDEKIHFFYVRQYCTL